LYRAVFKPGIARRNRAEVRPPGTTPVVRLLVRFLSPRHAPRRPRVAFRTVAVLAILFEGGRWLATSPDLPGWSYVAENLDHIVDAATKELHMSEAERGEMRVILVSNHR